MVSYQNSALISKSISLSFISTARILVKLLQVATAALAPAGLYRGTTLSLTSCPKSILDLKRSNDLNHQKPSGVA